MKNRSNFTKGLLTTLILSLCILACKKKDNTPDDKQPGTDHGFVTAPEAVAAEDNKSGGVYKGVLVGSTGYVKIIMQSGTRSVTVTMDGVTKNLDMVSFIPENWSSGQAITDALFSKDDWKIQFSVDADGNNPKVVAVIPGHDNIFVTITKEMSVTQVKTFEGTITYQGVSTNSAFNFVTSGELFIGHGRMPSENETHSMFGSVTNTTIKGKINNADVTGTIDGENASGTIVTPNATANWTAKRTL